MPLDGTTTWLAFLGGSGLVLQLFLLVDGRKSRLDTRLRDLSGKDGPAPELDSVTEFARAALPKMGASLVPTNEAERTRLQARLVQAGFYGRQAMVLFLGVKVLLIVCPPLLGLAAGVVGLTATTTGLIFGCLSGAFGLVLPGFWLDRCKTARQVAFRRALPDALDVLVICLEGGLSLSGAFRRVATELRSVHPKLAAELRILQREVQLGLSTGEVLRQFADRADMEEIRSLASVITQSERFGASLVKALRVHAEALRGKRLQQAEEMAQKAATKVLIPTVLLIFPGVFIVILGPAGIQVMAVLQQIGQR